MTAAVTPAQVWSWLEDVLDPEVPALSVVDLGIVRDVRVSDAGVEVDVTPTYSGCPAVQVIERDIRETLERHGVHAVALRTTFSPAWTTEWISDAGRAKLEAYGIAAPGPVADAGDLVQLLRAPRAVRCPFCRSGDTTLRSAFGSTACKALHFCNACAQPFEEFKAI